MQQLEDKVAVVTGAGSGIGRGSAVALAGAGASVVVNDLSEESATEVADFINDGVGTATVHCPSRMAFWVRQVKSMPSRFRQW